jgi:TolB-like protein/Tfp pilus assembly protein PilF
MPSIIPGFEYDIFISYRHKDNKYDGWISEFVNNLKKEIAATFKEELSIYFDENPQDGLLETQHVDKSLEGKLKCLIFIPILSQTYCDPNSFAWKNEFCAFRKLADEDAFGLYIRLPNGNVDSRILPVTIHELDLLDNQMLDKELGGMLRSVSFIYRTPGVNRPLRAHEDEPKENLNHIFYRDQINKVANTIKRTIAGMRMKGPGEKIMGSPFQPVNKPTHANRKKIAIPAALILIILAVGLYYFQSRHAGNDNAVMDRSIAVLPFADMSSGKDQEYFSDGLSEELLNLLAKVPDLKVISRTSSFFFKGKNEDVRVIGEKLGVAHLLEGSVRKSGNAIRITVQLIKVNNGAHIWSETYDRTMDDIFKVQDEIAKEVVHHFKITLSGSPTKANVADTESYNLYLQGNFIFAKRGVANIAKAIQLYQQALSIDSTNARAWASLSIAYSTEANNELIDPDKGFKIARQAAEKAISLDNDLVGGHAALAWIKTTHDWDWSGAEAEYQKALSLDPANVGLINGMATLATTLGKVTEAIHLHEKAIELDPLRVAARVNLGVALMFANQPREAIVSLKKALDLNSGLPIVHRQLGLCYLLLNEQAAAVKEMLNEPEEDWKMQGLAIIYFRMGKKKEADSLLKEFIKKFQNISAFQIAEMYADRNESDEAFKWLELAYTQRDGGLINLLGNPWLTKIERDTRYTPFVKKMKLPVRGV